MSDRDVVLTNRVTVRLPAILSDRLDTAVEEGRFENRSEAVRKATQQLLDATAYGTEQRQEAD